MRNQEVLTHGNAKRGRNKPCRGKRKRERGGKEGGEALELTLSPEGKACPWWKIFLLPFCITTTRPILAAVIPRRCNVHISRLFCGGMYRLTKGKGWGHEGKAWSEFDLTCVAASFLSGLSPPCAWSRELASSSSSSRSADDPLLESIPELRGGRRMYM